LRGKPLGTSLGIKELRLGPGGGILVVDATGTVVVLVVVVVAGTVVVVGFGFLVLALEQPHARTSSTPAATNLRVGTRPNATAP
jgi:hypothetical protein